MENASSFLEKPDQIHEKNRPAQKYSGRGVELAPSGAELLSFQTPGCIENGDEGNAHVGKDSLPHGSQIKSAQDHHRKLHNQGKPDILVGDPQRLAGNPHGGGDF